MRPSANPLSSKGFSSSAPPRDDRAETDERELRDRPHAGPRAERSQRPDVAEDDGDRGHDAQ